MRFTFYKNFRKVQVFRPKSDARITEGVINNKECIKCNIYVRTVRIALSKRQFGRFLLLKYVTQSVLKLSTELLNVYFASSENEMHRNSALSEMSKFFSVLVNSTKDSS